MDNACIERRCVDIKKRKKSDKLSTRLKGGVASIPQSLIVKAGRLLGVFIYNVDLRHQRIVRRNLQLIRSDWSQNRITRFSRAVFQNFGITIIEVLQMTCLSKENILKRVRVIGEENLQKVVKSPKGFIFISAHLGNWEMLCLFLSAYLEVPSVAVGRDIRSRMLNRLIHGLRGRFGNISIGREGAFPIMSKVLRQGGAAGLIIDQGAKSSEGIDVTFLGRDTNATPAAALLSMRCDCPILPVFCVRLQDGRLAIIARSPVSMEKSGDLRADLQRSTQTLTNIIEKAVNEYPEQWFWAHKRWKRNYPHYYREDIARRKRQKSKRKV